MAQPRKRKPTSEEILKTIINKMFEISGHDVTYDDIAGRKDAWYTEWTMTTAQNDEWKKWMVEYFKKECKMFSKIAERQASMCVLNWGLRFSDPIL